MKKLMMALLVMAFSFTTAYAQEEVKVKKTSSPKQKVHNVFSKNKQYNGVKAKHKVNGRKRKVEVKDPKVEVKDNTLLLRRQDLELA